MISKAMMISLSTSLRLHENKLYIITRLMNHHLSSTPESNQFTIDNCGDDGGSDDDDDEKEDDASIIYIVTMIMIKTR